MGAAQLIDLREHLESWEGTLEPNDMPVEVATQCTNLLSRIATIDSKIDTLLQSSDVEQSEASTHRIPQSKERTEEVLGAVARRLSELEAQVSAEEEAWAKMHIDLAERQTLLDKLGPLTGGTEQPEVELPLPARDEQVDASQKAHRGELSAIRVAVGLEKQKLEMEQLIAELKPMLGKIRSDLVNIHETTQRETLIVDAQSHLLRTSKTLYFEAYVPSSEITDVINSIKSASDGDCLVSDESPSPDERVPTAEKLAPGYMLAAEKLVLASGYPSRLEVNPIPLMAVTFPLLFGIMFADVGQGLIFILVGAILTFFKRKIQLDELGDIERYVFTSSELFILLGLFAIFFGFLFGEFFGPSGVIHPLSLGTIGPFFIGGFEPTHEPMKMLRFALLVGVAHLSVGIVLRVINEVKRRHFKHIPISLCWLWLLLGGLFMWAYWGGISNISQWFSEGILMLGSLIIMPLILMILFTGLVEGFMEGIGFGVEVFAETLSHTLSYCRLMALGLVHSVLNNLFLVLGGVEHGHFPPSSIPLIAIGTILVMTVEGLIVFVHSLRLHWIEWFSKFYSGEGSPFKPFTYKSREGK